jgi:predicted TPR repeat methyltransferase
MGVCQSQLGDGAAAARHFLKAVSLAPNFGRAWLNLAFLHEQRGEDRASLAAYRRVLKLDPRNAIAAAAARRLSSRKQRA